MLPNPANCPEPDCNEPIKYWQVHCRCGHFLGYPNYREALAERDELMRRYVAARDDAEQRGAGLLLDKLEVLAEQSRPVIAIAFSACDDILRPGKYRNYDQRVESGEREPAVASDHADREKVGATLFNVYSRQIVYAALSPSERGLLSYGPVAVRWEVTAAYIGRRASLLENNSYTFFNQHGLGALGATVPPGYRATWQDRVQLVAAKLAARLTPTTSESTLASMIMRAGNKREDDDFVEVAIYADGGLDTRDVTAVTLHRAPTTGEEFHRRDLIREICVARGIAFTE
jgi:hypothetical protein